MSKDNIQDFLIFQLEYKATIESKIKVFSDYFVEKNKKKCKIIYDKKEYEIAEYFEIDNNLNNDNIIKIQLKINNNITDISNMFNGCETLLSFRDISNLNDCNNVNEPLNDSEYNNYIDESNNQCEDEENENIYNDNLTLSSIPSKNNISEFTGINDELINKLNIQSKKKIFNNITNISSMFKGCSSLISLPDISKWDTKNVTYMDYMFKGCSSLISLPDISKWNTKNIYNMRSMFEGCSSLISLPDISKWGTKNVADMYSMFKGCDNLLNIFKNPLFN